METYNCQNCKKDFTIEPDDFLFYEMIQVPPPTFCPDCRLQRRLSSYNIRTLYKRQCSKCDKSIISIYPPDSKLIVYCTSCYFSDTWDATEYGRDYDFSRPFFEQFAELRDSVPQLHVRHSNNNGEGCEYANSSSHCAYVYLSYGVVGSEYIYYSSLVNKENRMCMDSLNIKKNELGYELVNANGNANCQYLTDSNLCIDSAFLYNCHNCQNCFMSTNLRNKKYCFRNEELSKEEYCLRLAQESMGTREVYDALVAEYERMYIQAIHPYATILKSEDCTGDMIENCKNVKHSFNIWGCENLKYSAFLMNTNKDTYDVTVSGRGERTYELVTSGGGNFDTKFCHRARGGQDMEYVDACKADHLFGCVGIGGGEYCIFNKQYSKEDFEVLKKKIIEHMKTVPYTDIKGRTYFYGEYFPAELSSCCYNESAAIEEFPLTKEEALALGFKWRDKENKEHATTTTASFLPRDIKDVTEEVCKEIVLCEHEGVCADQCTRGFRIIPEELQFYKRMNIPLPHLCPNCRYYKRRKRRNPWKLWQRTCMCTQTNHDHEGTCKNAFETSHSPDKPGTIYCKNCYQKEVI